MSIILSVTLFDTFIKKEAVILLIHMAVTTTSGSFDFNLDKLSEITNNSLEIGAKTTEGTADMAPIMGIGLGVAIAMSLIAIGISAVLAIVFLIFLKMKGFTKTAKGF